MMHNPKIQLLYKNTRCITMQSRNTLPLVLAKAVFSGVHSDNNDKHLLNASTNVWLVLD